MAVTDYLTYESATGTPTTVDTTTTTQGAAPNDASRNPTTQPSNNFALYTDGNTIRYRTQAN